MTFQDWIILWLSCGLAAAMIDTYWYHKHGYGRVPWWGPLAMVFMTVAVLICVLIGEPN